jgi:hypothetical protein
VLPPHISTLWSFLEQSQSENSPMSISGFTKTVFQPLFLGLLAAVAQRGLGKLTAGISASHHCFNIKSFLTSTSRHSSVGHQVILTSTSGRCAFRILLNSRSHVKSRSLLVTRRPKDDGPSVFWKSLTSPSVISIIFDNFLVTNLSPSKSGASSVGIPRTSTMTRMSLMTLSTLLPIQMVLLSALAKRSWTDILLKAWNGA